MNFNLFSLVSLQSLCCFGIYLSLEEVSSIMTIRVPNFEFVVRFELMLETVTR